MTEVVPGTLALWGRRRHSLVGGGRTFVFSGKSHFKFSGDGTFPTPLRRCHQNEPRPMISYRGRWKAKPQSTGRDIAAFLRPSAFSKCHRAHFCGKIAAVGRHFIYPPAAPKEMFLRRHHEMPRLRTRKYPASASSQKRALIL